MDKGLPPEVCAAASTGLLPPRDERGQGHLRAGAVQVVHVHRDVAVVQSAQAASGCTAIWDRLRAKDGSGGVLLCAAVAGDEGGGHHHQIPEALQAVHSR